MKPKEFHDKLDDARIVAAIQDAERRTSGEIRVFVTARKLGGDDPLKRAQARFVKLGMTATRERNGVLIYFAPHDQRFAIVGDEGIDRKCGPDFWKEISAQLQKRLVAGEFTDGIVEAIRNIGEALAGHFPRREDDVNELPDHVDRD